jgi:hypothetical protein
MDRDAELNRLKSRAIQKIEKAARAMDRQEEIVAFVNSNFVMNDEFGLGMPSTWFQLNRPGIIAFST